VSRGKNGVRFRTTKAETKSRFSGSPVQPVETKAFLRSSLAGFQWSFVFVISPLFNIGFGSWGTVSTKR